ELVALEQPARRHVVDVNPALHGDQNQKGPRLQLNLNGVLRLLALHRLRRERTEQRQRGERQELPAVHRFLPLTPSIPSLPPPPPHPSGPPPRTAQQYPTGCPRPRRSPRLPLRLVNRLDHCAKGVYRVLVLRPRTLILVARRERRVDPALPADLLTQTTHL